MSKKQNIEKEILYADTTFQHISHDQLQFSLISDINFFNTDSSLGAIMEF